MASGSCCMRQLVRDEARMGGAFGCCETRSMATLRRTRWTDLNKLMRCDVELKGAMMKVNWYLMKIVYESVLVMRIFRHWPYFSLFHLQCHIIIHQISCRNFRTLHHRQRVTGWIDKSAEGLILTLILTSTPDRYMSAKKSMYRVFRNCTSDRGSPFLPTSKIYRSIATEDWCLQGGQKVVIHPLFSLLRERILILDTSLHSTDSADPGCINGTLAWKFGWYLHWCLRDCSASLC
jgi:hypothetical protein